MQCSSWWEEVRGLLCARQRFQYLSSFYWRSEVDTHGDVTTAPSLTVGPEVNVEDAGHELSHFFGSRIKQKCRNGKNIRDTGRKAGRDGSVWVLSPETHLAKQVFSQNNACRKLRGPGARRGSSATVKYSAMHYEEDANKEHNIRTDW